MTRAPETVMAELAQLAAWYHWPLGSLLDLDPLDRRFYLDQLSDGGAADVHP